MKIFTTIFSLIISILFLSSPVFSKSGLRWSFKYLEDKADKEKTDFIEIVPSLEDSDIWLPLLKSKWECKVTFIGPFTSTNPFMESIHFQCFYGGKWRNPSVATKLMCYFDSYGRYIDESFRNTELKGRDITLELYGEEGIYDSNV